ncbi:MAG: 50S ribosomal protein L11 methyltransferase [Nitrospiria bacterium]
MSMNPKTYLEVSVEVEPEFQESLSSYFIEAGASGAWIDGKAVKAFFNSALFTGEQVGKKTAAFFLEFRREGVNIESGPMGIQKQPCDDWNAEWKKFFKPINITPRLTISPPWESLAIKQDQLSEQREREGEASEEPYVHCGTAPKASSEEGGDASPRDRPKVILIDPGLGFGTGNHPTTRNCLVLLDRLFQSLKKVSHLKVLDLGSGSGILAIAAARLGAGYIVAADIDGDAVESMRHNFILNRVHHHIRLRLGSLFQADRRGYDLILANLTAEELIRVSRELQGALLAGGRLILSGILAEKTENLEKALHELNLEKRDEILEEKWATQLWQMV